jgi:hypothetical protein
VRDLAVLFLHLLATVAAWPVPVAPVPWSPNPCSSSSSCSSLIVPGNDAPISASLIAWSPACVHSSSARVG